MRERLHREAIHDINVLAQCIRAELREGKSPSDTLRAVAAYGPLDPATLLVPLVRHSPLGPWRALEALGAATSDPVAQAAVLFRRRKAFQAHPERPRYWTYWHASAECRACCRKIRDPLSQFGDEPRIGEHWRSLTHCMHIFDVQDREPEVRAYAKALSTALSQARRQYPAQWLDLWLEHHNVTPAMLHERLADRLTHAQRAQLPHSPETIVAWRQGDDIPEGAHVRAALEATTAIPASAWKRPNALCTLPTERWSSPP